MNSSIAMLIFITYTAVTFLLCGMERNTVDVHTAMMPDSYNSQLEKLKTKPDYKERDEIIKRLVEDHCMHPDKIQINGNSLIYYVIETYYSKTQRTVHEWGITNYLIDKGAAWDIRLNDLIEESFKSFIICCQSRYISGMSKSNKELQLFIKNEPEKKIKKLRKKRKIGNALFE